MYKRQVSHTTYAVLESLDMQSVTNLLRPQMSFGDVQVLPVEDGIDMRKERGHWGKMIIDAQNIAKVSHSG